MKKSEKFILWFSEISQKDIFLVGGKNASLGEMYQKLTKKPKNIKTEEQIDIPNGFAITSYAFQYFLEKNNIKEKIKNILETINVNDIKDLSKKGHQIRHLILFSDFPPELKEVITKAYRKLNRLYSKPQISNLKPQTDVAVRSSATAEDLPTASFAGQLESFLNIRGEKALLETVKKCFSSLYTNRVISYSHDQGLKHSEISLSVGVQKMVRSDIASAGVMFSCDTETGFDNVVLINASYGLGENIVKGRVNPDEFYVFEPTLEKGFKSIIGKKLGSKKFKLIYSKGGKVTRNVFVLEKDRNKFSLTDEEILTLARWSMIIENHYRQPMDMEWAKDGILNKLFIVQARPETVKIRREKNILEEYAIEKSKIKSQKSKILCKGSAIGTKIGQGKVRIIRNVRDIDKFKKGEVLVTKMTDPDWEPIMKKASAIVTDSGGRTCHAAIVSRELGVPCVVGTGGATEILKHEKNVTVSCTEGEEGYVYKGLLPFKIKRTNLKELKKPKIKVMMNVGQPDQAFSLSFIPNDGVGLAREEFIISNFIKIHPLALLDYKRHKNRKTKELIDKLTYGYKDKSQFFIDKLAEGIARIASAFYPKEVIVRFSDFKTNEYANLIGGEGYEPKEANPMIGWRGASRYYDPKYKEAFVLECVALKKVREEMGLDNVNVMVPFCRTIKEGKKVLEIIDEYGLRQVTIGKRQLARKSHVPYPMSHVTKPLKIYVMCEIPSNVILAKEFSEIFDGFSIGSNDLTQLTLGIDRDSELISHIYDERNEAVKKLIKEVIKIARKAKRKIGICGQAPSDFPDFAEFLVKCGIDSISLNPDTVIKTTLRILKAEEKLRKR